MACAKSEIKLLGTRNTRTPRKVREKRKKFGLFRAVRVRKRSTTVLEKAMKYRILHPSVFQQS